MTAAVLHRLLIVLLFVGLVLPARGGLALEQAGAVAGLGGDGVSIGILATRPQAQAQWAPLGEELRAHLGQPVRIVALDSESMELAIRRREVDFILTNPANYLRLAGPFHLSAPLCSLVVSEEGVPLNVFGGVIFTRADSPVRQLSDLDGRKIAVSTLNSLGGYQMQAFELMSAGLKLPDTRHLVLTGMPYDRVVEAVLEGKAEVGFVRTGVLEAMVREGRLAPETMRVLHRQNLPHFPYASSTRLYPEWVFVGMPQVDTDLARQVTAALLALPHDGPTARKIGIWGFTIPMDYEPVREMMRTLRVPPFEQASDCTLADVWQRYRMALIAALVLAALNLGLLVVVWRKQRRLMELNATIRAQGREIESQSTMARQLLGALNEGVYGVGPDGRCTFINPAALRLLGYASEAEVLGKDNHALFHRWRADGTFYPEEQCPIHQTLQDGQARQAEDEWFWRKDGTGLPVSLRVSPVGGDDGIRGAVVAFHDITERKRLLETLRHQATHDELTGLVNRRHLFELAEREHARIRRGQASPAAIIMVDVDHFKRINDTYGHLAGDAILRHLGQFLCAKLRTTDIAARYGGEEFILMLPSTDLDAALRLAARLREEAAASTVYSDGQPLHFTLSLGLTALTAQDPSLDVAIARADEALYRAKMGGRNRIEVDPQYGGV
ncbi:MAG: diguanylate cyclase [Gammaproteobacteria bacterium]|nr:diguanylate cyclase [Gammaproteobacteria bacterium]